MLKKILKKLKKGSVVTMTDYSEYECGQSNTGGAYSYTQRYEKMKNGNWKISFFTSSSFNYCEYCGTFQNGECGCGEEYEEIDLEELVGVLEYAWADPNHDVIINKNLKKIAN